MSAPPIQKVLGFAEFTEPEGLDPGETVEGEAVIELGHIDISGRSEVRVHR